MTRGMVWVGMEGVGVGMEGVGVGDAISALTPH